MDMNPLAEKLPSPSMLVNILRLVTAYYTERPDPAVPAQRFPLPRSLWDEGLRRYGFHGLSYEYIVEALGTAANGRVIIAH